MECEYCGEELDKTKGKMVVLSSGEKLHFCSGKCEKNWRKNRSHDYQNKE
ncbi:MAG: hypothetical protein ABEJ56_05435 [Candidatus Nanohaloarchaea archaeon]